MAGGIGTYVNVLATSLANLGFKVTVVTGRSSDPNKMIVEKPSRNLTVVRVWFPDKPVRSVWYQLLNKKLILRLAAEHDIVHTNGFDTSLIIKELTKVGKAVIVTQHGSMIDQTEIFLRASKSDFIKYATIHDLVLYVFRAIPVSAALELDYEYSDFTIFVARHVKESFERIYGIKNGASRVIYPGLKLRINTHASSNTANNNKCLFLYAGRLYFLKGPQYALIAFKVLRELNPELDCELHIYGRGPMKSRLRNYVRKRKLDPFVKFMGFVRRDQYLNNLQKYKIFVFPSLYEAAPLAMFEALAMKIPVVTFAMPWVIEYKEMFKNAICLAPPYDEETLASCIAKLSTLNYSRITEEFPRELTAGYMVEEIVNIYKQFA